MQLMDQEIDAPERLAAAMGWSGNQLIGREIRGPSGRPIRLQNAHLDGEAPSSSPTSTDMPAPKT